MGGKVAGIAAIVLSLVSAVGGVVFFSGHHTKRALGLAIVFVVLLVLGIVLLVRSGRKK
jgi:glucose uptake protein GlcU